MSIEEESEFSEAGQKAIIGQVEARVDLLESNNLNEKIVIGKTCWGSRSCDPRNELGSEFNS